MNDEGGRKMIQVFSKKRNILGNEKGAVFITGLPISFVN